MDKRWNLKLELLVAEHDKLLAATNDQGRNQSCYKLIALATNLLDDILATVDPILSFITSEMEEVRSSSLHFTRAQGEAYSSRSLALFRLS